MLRSMIVSAALGLAVLAPAGLPAQTQVAQPDIAALTKTLQIEKLIEVMRAEGLVNGAEMEADLFGGQVAPGWSLLVGNIYEPARLQQIFDAALTQALAGDSDGATTAAMTAFFGSVLGQRIIGLEVDARRALLDKAAVDKAGQAWDQLVAEKSARAGQIERFTAANDLIESNVMGALNANLAFYRGLSAGGAFPQLMPEAEMLAEVWGQEAEIRKDTVDWLYPFLTLAYQPLSDAEFDAYIAFSESPAGHRANSVIFAAFDAMFVEISHELGQSAAQLMAGQDI